VEILGSLPEWIDLSATRYIIEKKENYEEKAVLFDLIRREIRLNSLLSCAIKLTKPTDHRNETDPSIHFGN
jgi:hypothetical protein